MLITKKKKTVNPENLSPRWVKRTNKIIIIIKKKPKNAKVT